MSLHRTLLSGLLLLTLADAFAEGLEPSASPAIGLQPGERAIPGAAFTQRQDLDWDETAGTPTAAGQAGVLPVGLDTRIGYDLRFDPDVAPTAKLTTLHRLSPTDTLSLRLEHGGDRRLYWSHLDAGREQRAGLFPTTIGSSSRHLLGWQYSKGYPVVRESLPTSGAPALKPSSGSSRHTGWPTTLSPAAPASPGSRATWEDAVGRRASTAFAHEQRRIQQAVRGDGLLPSGRRDYKFAAGSGADSGSPFLGGELREGLTPTWTVEAGGYVDESATVFAKSRWRMGPGLLRMETRNDTGVHHTTQRVAYVLGNTALSVDRLDATRSLGARLHGRGYYAAYDHGLNGEERRLSAGYASDIETGRVSVHCEARTGDNGSRYCGVGLLVPLQPGGVGRLR